MHAEKAVAKLVEDGRRGLSGAVCVQHVPDHPELRSLELPYQRTHDCRGGIAVVGLGSNRRAEPTGCLGSRDPTATPPRHLALARPDRGCRDLRPKLRCLAHSGCLRAGGRVGPAVTLTVVSAAVTSRAKGPSSKPVIEMSSRPRLPCLRTSAMAPIAIKSLNAISA